MGLVIVFMGCTIWFPLMVWIVSLVHWMIGGDIDIVSGFLGISAALALGYLAMAPPVPGMAGFAYITVLITVFMYPAVRSALNRRERKSIDIDAIQRAYDALGQKPDNPLAKFKLARHVYAVGMIGHGVALADEAMKGLPENQFTEEFRILKRWKRAGVPPSTLTPITCAECGSPCVPGWTHCHRCGAPFLLERARGKVLPSGVGRKLVAVWIALVAIILGIPLATTLPPAVSIVVVLTLLLAAGALVYKAFQKTGGLPA